MRKETLTPQSYRMVHFKCSLLFKSMLKGVTGFEKLGMKSLLLCIIHINEYKFLFCSWLVVHLQEI